jgi:hypothetical protein
MEAATFLRLSAAGILVQAGLQLVISSIFLLAGAKLARVRDASFGRAIGTAFLYTLVAIALPFVLLATGTVSVSQPMMFVAGIVILLLLIMAVFRTSFGKALLVWIFGMLAQVAVVALASAGILGVLMRGGWGTSP